MNFPHSQSREDCPGTLPAPSFRDWEPHALHGKKSGFTRQNDVDSRLLSDWFFAIIELRLPFNLGGVREACGFFQISTQAFTREKLNPLGFAV
jgi:hypothetical protein